VTDLPPFYVRKSRTVGLWELTDARTDDVIETEHDSVTYRTLLAKRDKLNAEWATERGSRT